MAVILVALLQGAAKHISVVSSGKPHQIPTRFSHCFHANPSVWCVPVYRSEWGWAQYSTLFSWRKRKSFVWATFKDM